MLLLAICILGLGTYLAWMIVPDLCFTGEKDANLPPLGDSIDRAIALAAALPPEDYDNELIDDREKANAVAGRYLAALQRRDRPGLN